MTNIAIDLGRTFFGGTSPHPTEQVTGLGEMMSVFLSNAIILAGIIFFLMIIYSGFKMIIGAGQGNPQNMEEAKKNLTTSFIGFSLVFATFFIIRIIEQITSLNIL